MPPSRCNVSRVNRLKEVMDKQGVSAAVLADTIGAARPWIYDYQAERRNPSRITKTFIAKVLWCDVEEIWPKT
jgi:DNA-binding XRE family transcriptional regulator